MKKTTLTLIMMLASCMVFSQGVAINEDGTAPHASAMLEVTSTEKGVLIPRMTQAQRNAINEPAYGLLIYQSDETPGFYYNAGTPATPDWQIVGSNAGTFSQWTDSGNNIYFNEGNVGVGLDNPQHQLHINVSLKAGQGYFGTMPQNILGLGPDFYGGETGLFDIDADKLIAGKDYTTGVYQYGGEFGSSEGLFINSGKVGIGIQNPEQKLHVAGNAYFGDNYPLAIAHDLVGGELGLFKVDKDLLIAGIINPGQTDLVYQYGGFAGSNEGLFIKSGDLGIGIQNPTHRLDIDGLVRIRSGDPGPGKVLTSDADGVASWETPEGGSKWSETGNNIYRIEGGVGIGVPAPLGKLHVSEPGLWEGIVFTGTGLNDLVVDISEYNGTGATAYAIRIENAGPNPNLIQISNDGGVSWSASFPITNPVNLDFGVTASFGNTSGYTYNDQWNWTVNESFKDVLVVKNGNIGLGTANPSHTLDVDGLIRIRGGNPGEGKVLASNENGVASWVHMTSAMSCLDIDGNAYPTIIIGGQIWMAENLRVKHYRNGDPIPNVTNNADWAALSNGAYCWYENNESANAKYGALYNWYAVDDPRGLCPEGWKMPTDDDWTDFINMIGGQNAAGGKMKSISSLWESPNVDASNLTGFSGLPGGSRITDGSFSVIGSYGYWWSSSEQSDSDAWIRFVRSVSGSVTRVHPPKKVGFSVRCLKE